MKSFRFIGILIAAIGYVSGALLVTQPFVAEIHASRSALGALFPLCVLLGLTLYAAGEQYVTSLRISGWLLLLIGLAALVGLFFKAAGFPCVRVYETGGLWLIAPGSLLFGLLVTFFADALERFNQKPATA